MRIAIPLIDGRLARHFGHCEAFAMFDTEPASRAISVAREIPAPEHQPGLLPGWLKERGVTTVIAGDMGDRAQSLLAAIGIEVVTGAPDVEPRSAAEQYLAGTLPAVGNHCDHKH